MGKLNISNYTLDEDSQKDLLESELNTNIENLSEELSGYQLNSDKKIAWITSITEKEDNKIVVEFLLPSSDTFSYTYSVPNKTLPKENLFRQLIESSGYTVNSIDMIIGEQIDIRYNNSTNEWEPKIHSETKDSSNNNLSFPIKISNYVFLLILSIPLILLLFRFTRFYGILVIISMYLGFYLLKN